MSNPLGEANALQDGIDEEVVPGDDTSKMLSCHKIWCGSQICIRSSVYYAKISTGICYKIAQTSKTAILILMHYVLSFERKPAAPRRVLLLTKMMLMPP